MPGPPSSRRNGRRGPGWGTRARSSTCSAGPPRSRRGWAAAGRVVVAHLGNGSSLCALRAGRSVATTMGFSSLDGLPMGTRCGALDPGVLLLFLNHLHLDGRALEAILYEESGLLGVSGIS